MRKPNRKMKIKLNEANRTNNKRESMSSTSENEEEMVEEENIE